MGCRSQYQVMQPEVEVGLDGIHIPYPTPKLYRDRNSPDNFFYGRLIYRFSLECAVQVNKVQSFSSLLKPSHGHVFRGI